MSTDLSSLISPLWTFVKKNCENIVSNISSDTYSSRLFFPLSIWESHFDVHKSSLSSVSLDFKSVVFFLDFLELVLWRINSFFISVFHVHLAIYCVLDLNRDIFHVWHFNTVLSHIFLFLFYIANIFFDLFNMFLWKSNFSSDCSNMVASVRTRNPGCCFSFEMVVPLKCPVIRGCGLALPKRYWVSVMSGVDGQRSDPSVSSIELRG